MALQNILNWDVALPDIYGVKKANFFCSNLKIKVIINVEALRKRLSVKIKLWNGETVYVTFCNISTCGCDLFNYRAIKLVTYTVCMWLNRSCTQCACEKYKRSNYHCNYWLITKGKLWLTGNYNLPLIITVGFCIYIWTLFFYFICEYYSVFFSMQKI